MSHRSSLRSHLTWAQLEHRLTRVLRGSEGFRAHCACEWDGEFKETRKGAVREHARHVTDDALMPHVDAHVDGNLAGDRSDITVGPRGVVVAVAEIVGCHYAGDQQARCAYRGSPPCSPWAEPDRWHWQFARVRRLTEAVSCRGALGLWRLPA